ncbi:MAG: DUF4157 domain-containing protein [Pyrinomonadaceae bacterium]|nr:DUF4157 domain-containing protein [Pyrinomonadaceae bacterium]
MDKNSSTTNPANAKTAAQTSANVPTNQSEPSAAAEGQSASFGQRAVEAVGGGSSDAPPASFGSLLNRLEGSTAGQASVLRQLQQSYGNRYVGQVIQAKLKVSQPGDSHEQEADHAADVAMSRMEDPQSHATGGAQAPAVEAGGGASQGGGQSLPDDLQQQMGRAYGADFKNVSVHTDGESEVLNESLKARAFTTGQDVFFGRGQYNPQNAAGRELIAHELAHVVQQSGRGQHNPGTGVTLNSISSGSIQRDAADELKEELPEEKNKKTFEKSPSEIIKESGEFGKQEQERAVTEATPAIMTTTNVADQNRAEDLITLIKAQRGNIGAHPDAALGKAMLAQNENTLAALTSYVKVLQQQDLKSELFKRIYLQVKLDASRLEGQKAGFIGLHSELENEELTDTEFAGAVIKGDAQSMQAGSAGMKAQSKDPAISEQRAVIRGLLKQVKVYPDRIISTMEPAVNALDRLRTAARNVKAGPIVRNPTPEQEEANKEVASIEAELKAATDAVGKVWSIAQLAGTALGGIGAMAAISSKVGEYGDKATSLSMKAVGATSKEGKEAVQGAAGAMTGVSGQVATASGGAATTDIKGEIIRYFLDYDVRIGSAKGRVGTLKDAAAKEGFNIQIEELENAKKVLAEKINAYVAVLEEFEKIKAQLREEVDLLSEKLGMPKKGGSDLATAMQFLSETTILSQQCDAALKVGAKEQQDAEKAEEGRTKVAGHDDPTIKGNSFTGEFTETTGGMSYHRVERNRNPDIQKQYTHWETKVVFTTTPKTQMQTGSMLKKEIDDAMAEIREIKDKAEAIRSRLAVVLGTESKT